jgi:hypothetical protein
MCGVKQITVRILSLHSPAENSMGIIYIHSYIENCADIISSLLKNEMCGYYLYTLKHYRYSVCIISSLLFIPNK